MDGTMHCPHPSEFPDALRTGKRASIRGIPPGFEDRCSDAIPSTFRGSSAQGRLVVETCNLADVVDEAKRLSATYTLTGGHRGFDILHIAAALKAGAKAFLTFDDNQKKLAAAERLHVPF